MPPFLSKRDYDATLFTYGCEFEVGDVPKALPIPESLGAWEYAETDIVNILPPYQYVAVDPLGEDPPVGGEVNTRPTRGWHSQVQILDALLQYFRSSGASPTVCCLSEFHVHVHVPGLTEDVSALKRLTRYIVENQALTIEKCGQYDEKLLQGSKVSRSYLKWDMGRQMPQWMADNICGRAASFNDFLYLQCCGRDGLKRARPIRYAINTYCLKHTQTVEFRLFRSSLSLCQLADCFRFCANFMNYALNGGPSVEEMLSLRGRALRFPPFTYSLQECLGWEKTKWGKDRGRKERRYVAV